MPRDQIGGDQPSTPRRGVVRFGDFALRPDSGELWRNGSRQTLGEQPLAVLLALLERPGQLVTREELRQRLWPGDTFVDFEHGLNAAVKRLRDALQDSADTPRFIETLPRRGYRFIGECETADKQVPLDQTPAAVEVERRETRLTLGRRVWIAAAASIVVLSLLAWLAISVSRARGSSGLESTPRHVTMLAYGPGLQIDPTWSPDGRSVAYAWDKSGNFDIWTQRVAGGDPVQITRSPAQELEPDWSPDGSSLVFSRPEGKDGGVFIVPASGGPEQRLSTFGAQPKWSPDGSKVLFLSEYVTTARGDIKLFVVSSTGGAPRSVLSAVLETFQFVHSATWHPDGRRISIWGVQRCCAPHMSLLTASLDGSPPELWHLEKARGWPGDSVWRVEWDRSGAVVYVTVSVVYGTVEIWKVTVDAARREGIAAERIVGDGLHATLAVAADGRRLAFSSEDLSIRLWSFGLDPSGRAVHEPGRAISPAGAQFFATNPDLADDDRSLAYSATSPAGPVLWVTDVQDRTAKMIGTTGEFPLAHGNAESGRMFARWSHDGKRLAYFYVRRTADSPATVDTALAMWQRDTGDEAFLSAVRRSVAPQARETIMPSDWTSDDAAILVVSNRSTPTMSIGLWPVSAQPPADSAVKVLASDPSYDLWQARFSPNGRWIACVVQDTRDLSHARLAIMPSSDGNRSRWQLLGDPQGWTDKPRWSPNGRILYFTRLETGYLNVWGQAFNPDNGTAVGAPFKVTHFDSPAFHTLELTGLMEPTVSRTQLILPIEQKTGRILIMDNVNR